MEMNTDREAAELDITLSDSQLRSFNTLVEHFEENTEGTLIGPAGTGKTTMLREFADYYQSVGRPPVLVAPTGKASLNLQKKTGRLAQTVHRATYGKPEVDPESGELLWTRPRAPCTRDEILICDEASMVGKQIYNDMMSLVPRGAKVLFVGDKEQLPPVKDDWGPNLESATAELTEIHRQAAGSIIIQYATAIRECRAGEFYRDYQWDNPDLIVGGDFDHACDWALQHNARGNDYTVITYTNAVRNIFNATMRKALGLDIAPISVGDLLLVRQNNHGLGLMNGEVVRVTSVTPMDYDDPEYTSNGVYVELDDFPVPVKINLNLIGASRDKFYKWKQGSRIGRLNRWVLVDYGQCLTVHAAQGSQWENVAFLWDKKYNDMREYKPTEARRLLYTAATRAETRLALFQIEDLL